MCQSAIEDPKEFAQPAPHVLQTIISELDFKFPTCSKTAKVHELPHHQEQGCTPAHATVAHPLSAYRLILHKHDHNTAAAPTTSVPAEIPQPAADPDNITEQAQLQVPPAPVA